jgi:UDP-2,3-diacylglucosamine pyrophosphatase LpxH
MRALVLSDTHFGAWTGDDLLSREEHRVRLEPHLRDVDEVVFLGDLFDFLFGTVQGAFAAADGFFDLLRDRLQGKRFVYLAGNHDHHLVTRASEDLLGVEIATGRAAEEVGDEVARGQYFRRFLERRLDGVEVDIRYPAYSVGHVLMTHGHYLDPHARSTGSLGSRALTRALWSIAAGGREDPRTERDYESVTTLLTEVLYTIAQLPHGTEAQRSVFGAVQRAGRMLGAAAAPAGAVRSLAERMRRSRGTAGAATGVRIEPEVASHYRRALADERERLAGAPARIHEAARSYTVARVVRPSDPQEVAVEAIAKVAENLGWTRETNEIVFAHTHQPLAGVRAPSGPPVRYWNTGCWIYEPELSSPQAYARYLRDGWPGTAVLVDTDEPEPRMLELMADLNPLTGA